jgi:hypothetical protein
MRSAEERLDHLDRGVLRAGVDDDGRDRVHHRLSVCSITADSLRTIMHRQIAVIDPPRQRVNCVDRLARGRVGGAAW